MSKTNVGRVERALRLVLAAVLVFVSVILVTVRPSPLTIAVAAVSGLGAGLLVRSVRTAYCPIHESLGTGTSGE